MHGAGASHLTPQASGAPAPDTDTLSLLSLRTVASDLQKCDSVEHLRGLSDHTSLDGQELGPRSGSRGGRHQRSISL